MDSHTGPVSPVRHAIAGLTHQLNPGSNLELNVSAAAALLDEVVAKWREVRAAAKAGPVSMRAHWHPLYVSEDQWRE